MATQRVYSRVKDRIVTQSLPIVTNGQIGLIIHPIANIIHFLKVFDGSIAITTSCQSVACMTPNLDIVCVASRW